MSGHSKWSTIKRDKEKEDAKRGVLFSRHSREIVVAAKLGGDPNTNARLRRAIQAAKNISMPKDKIDYAIKRGIGDIPGRVYEEIIYEGYGPGGAAILVECLTDKKTRTVADIRFIFQKSGGSLGEKGCVSWMFETQNQFIFDKQTLQNKTNFSQFEEIAIEAGAEDIEETDKYISIFTSSSESFLEYLESKGFKPTHSHLIKKAKNQVSLQENKSKQVLQLLKNLEDLEDVQKTYCNLKDI